MRGARYFTFFWLVVWNICYFSIYWEVHHPNWRSHIFQRGRYTTNQLLFGVRWLGGQVLEDVCPGLLLFLRMLCTTFGRATPTLFGRWHIPSGWHVDIVQLWMRWSDSSTAVFRRSCGGPPCITRSLLLSAADPSRYPVIIHHPRFFLQIDLDGSGSLTKQEFFRATKQRSSVEQQWRHGDSLGRVPLGVSPFQNYFWICGRYSLVGGVEYNYNYILYNYIHIYI